MRGILISLVCVAVILGLSGWGYLYHSWNKDGPLVREGIVLIKPGMSLDSIAQTLEEEDVVSSSTRFSFLVRVFGEDDQLKSGEYRFRPQESARTVYERLFNHDVTLRRFTVPEGLSTAAVMRNLKSRTDLRGTLTVRVDEGSILPDTYLFRYGIDRNDLVQKMQRSMISQVRAMWENRSPSLPVTEPYQMLIVASLVQKEASALPDMRKVAGVIYNRLRRDMRLQIDSTVEYAITLGENPLERALTRADINTVSAYNTYQNNGLPPTPIANPGRKALQAASNPTLLSALYFVADGNGEHVFADTLSEHRVNVRAYRERIRNRP